MSGDAKRDAARWLAIAVAGSLMVMMGTATAWPYPDPIPEPMPPGKKARPNREYEMPPSHRDHIDGRTGFGALELGAMRSATDGEASAVGLSAGATLGAQLHPRVRVGLRGDAALAEATPTRPALREAAAGLGVDVRAWRRLWLGAGLAIALHRYDDSPLSTFAPAVRLRAGVDVLTGTDRTLYAVADAVTDLAGVHATQRVTLGVGVRFH